MKIIPFQAMPKHNTFFYNVIAMHQTGKNLDEFHYIQNPRPNSGLIFIQSPGLQYTLKDNSVLLPQKGDIMYLPEGAYYSVKFNSKSTKTILVNFNLKDSVKNSVIASNDICFLPKAPQYEEILSEICDIYTDKVENKLILNSKMYYLFNLLSTNQTENSPISYAINYINNHLTQNISIKELAKFSAMSESTFRREFKKETGTSPIKYILKEKIKKAKQLLCFSDLSVNEISITLGFFDTAHFCKTFKNVYGKTPILYKKDYQQSDAFENHI